MIERDSPVNSQSTVRDTSTLIRQPIAGRLFMSVGWTRRNAGCAAKRIISYLRVVNQLIQAVALENGLKFGRLIRPIRPTYR